MAGLTSYGKTTQDGTLAELSFDILGTTASTIPISFVQAETNEGSVVTSLQNGSVSIETIPGDFQPDGHVDIDDLVRFAYAWLSRNIDPDWDQACDISIPKDNVINVKDFSILAQNWLDGLN